VAHILVASAVLQDITAYTHTKGELIFYDEFEVLDESVWTHQVSGARGNNWAFQYYRNSRKNSFVRDGALHIQPTLTSDEYGEDFIYNGKIDLWEQGCRNEWNYDHGCTIEADGGDFIVNPIQSARLITKDKFSFRYGTVEISAKLPAGDWLWPALWLNPEKSIYGRNPRSGEIDLMEARGNEDLNCHNRPYGRQQVESTVHFGPSSEEKVAANWKKLNVNIDYSKNFHKYVLEWNPDGLSFFFDDELLGNLSPPDGGFWEYGGFAGENLWKNGSKMAPFDEDFYLIINIAVGGSYFPDWCTNGNGDKPWSGHKTNGSMKHFWEARNDWLATWNLGTDDNAFIIDYIKVWSL